MSPDLDRPFIWLALACMAGLCVIALIGGVTP
jgi:hypothetical protein